MYPCTTIQYIFGRVSYRKRRKCFYFFTPKVGFSSGRLNPFQKMTIFRGSKKFLKNTSKRGTLKKTFQRQTISSKKFYCSKLFFFKVPLFELFFFFGRAEVIKKHFFYFSISIYFLFYIFIFEKFVFFIFFSTHVYENNFMCVDSFFKI